MADLVYDEYIEASMAGQINLTGTTIHAILLSGSYNPLSGSSVAQQNHDSYRDIIRFEINGTNYPSGGQRLTGTFAFEGSSPTRTGVFDCPNINFPNSTITNASGVALYHSGGILTTARRLICWLDFGADKSSSNGDFTIQWSSSPLGILRVRQG